MKMRLGSIFTLCLVTMLFMTSCVREYICQCEVIYSGKAGLPDTAINEYPVTDTKKNAQADCQSKSFSAQQDGIKMEEKCDLY